jgi:primosomal protein N' (replication factor Y)
MTDQVGEPVALARAAARRRRAADLPQPQDAAGNPVAMVVVDVGLAHLDRPFEYSVPRALADLAVPGARVRVRFAGQDVDGFVTERAAVAQHQGPLSAIRKVVSPEPVLTPALLALCTAVADRYAGSLGDVLRLAIPPRHARAERALTEAGTAATADPEPVSAPGPGPWDSYPAGPSFLRRLADGEAPAASWLAMPSVDPDQDWPAALAVAAATALAAGRGAVLVCPDHRDVDRVDAALTALLGRGHHVRLGADQGPQARYTAWLKVLRGHVHCVVGTRAAAFAPVRDLGLVAWWDDGDDLLSEPRAPYPQVREVLGIRAGLESAALLAGGYSRTTATALAIEQGRLRPMAARPADVRQRAPRVLVAGEGSELERDPAAVSAHLPSLAWRTAGDALRTGPVLVQVPRRGYLPSLSCQSCRAPARCAVCHGPLTLTAREAPAVCGWCGTVCRDFACPHCEGRTLRSAVVGVRRTAEDIGRAFPGVPVHTSGAGAVRPFVAAAPSLVIATPGAEPVAESGYAATLLLDAWALLERPALDAGEEALRRWLAAAALTRGAASGGVVVLCGGPTHVSVPAVEALVRWDPAWFAERELGERRELALPPAVRMVRLISSRRGLRQARELLNLPGGVTELGPLPLSDTGTRPGAAGIAAGSAGSTPGSDIPPRSAPARVAGPADGERMQLLLQAALADGPALVTAAGALRAVWSARKEAESLLVSVDPADGIG